VKFNIEEIKEYILAHPNAKIFIGGDSQKVSNKKRKKLKIKDKTARFVTAVVVYEKDCNKIFFEVSKEKDIDVIPGKPFNRMMNETYKVADITLQLMDVLIDRDFYIHLDISKEEFNGSHCAMGAAIGYIWGVVGIEPILKPDSWVASTVADHIVKNNKQVLNFS
jgi:predicted RNase H-related nuclease YkuK (DUF458 family)